METMLYCKDRIPHRPQLARRDMRGCDMKGGRKDDNAPAYVNRVQQSTRIGRCRTITGMGRTLEVDRVTPVRQDVRAEVRARGAIHDRVCVVAGT